MEAAAALERSGPGCGTTLTQTEDSKSTLKTDNTQLKKQDTLLHQDFPHEQHSLKWNKSFNLCHGYILNGKSQTRTFSGQSTIKFLLTTICFSCNISANSSSSLRNIVYTLFLFNVEVSWLSVTKIQDHGIFSSNKNTFCCGYTQFWSLVALGWAC